MKWEKWLVKKWGYYDDTYSLDEIWFNNKNELSSSIELIKKLAEIIL